MPTTTVVQLKHDNKPADRDDEGLIIGIDVNKQTCHAREKEHVDPGKRIVKFNLNEKHKLFFSNELVFGMTETPDPEQKHYKLPVKATPPPSTEVETMYSLEPYLQTTKDSRGDPEIVVP